MNDTTPRGWTTEDARRDTSWIQRLSADEVAGFDAALAHAKAAGKPWLAMTADDFPLDRCRPPRAAARLRHHAGTLGHVPAEGLPGRPLERGRHQARVLGHGPARRRGAHPEPGQPVHERCARRRRGLQGGQRPQPRLQHQGRPGLPHGLVRRRGAALPAHREGRRREPGGKHDRGGRGAGAPPSRPAGGAQAALLPPLPRLAGPAAAAVLRLPDHRQRPRALRDAGQPQEHRRRPARLPGSCRASRPSSGRRSTCSRRSWPTRAGASACSSSRATCSSSTTT